MNTYMEQSELPSPDREEKKHTKQEKRATSSRAKKNIPFNHLFHPNTNLPILSVVKPSQMTLEIR